MNRQNKKWNMVGLEHHPCREGRGTVNIEEEVLRYDVATLFCLKYRGKDRLDSDCRWTMAAAAAAP